MDGVHEYPEWTGCVTGWVGTASYALQVTMPRVPYIAPPCNKRRKKQCLHFNKHSFLAC